MGIQIVAAPWREDRCLRVAAFLEAPRVSLVAFLCGTAAQLSVNRHRNGASVADLIAGFPGLAGLSPELHDVLLRSSSVAQVPAGTVIFGPGKAPENLLLLVDGSVRVQQTGEGGREIVLYRVGAGESCVLTTACLLGYEGSPAEGIAEMDIEAVLVPRDAFENLIVRSPEFRRLVFAAYSWRITDLCRVIEEIASRRIDVRLAGTLVVLAAPTAVSPQLTRPSRPSSVPRARSYRGNFTSFSGGDGWNSRAARCAFSTRRRFGGSRARD